MTGIIIKSETDLISMRRACQLAARTLVEAGKRLAVGVTTKEIDTFIHTYTLDNGAIPATLNYHGFPASVCTSINEVVCHGIPSNRTLRDGDIINIDVTSILDGWHGDVSATFFIGTPDAEARRLVETTRECLELGIAEVRPGARIGNIGAAIQQHAEAQGFSVVRDFVGHGIGKNFHEAPQVKHFGEANRGLRLKEGMTFTIEPMINQGQWRIRILDDGWTAVTADGSLSAQFEHTILVTATGAEVLTALPESL